MTAPLPDLALDRRQLVGGGAAALGTAALATTVTRQASPVIAQEAATPAAASPGDGWIEPPVIRSEDGLLVTTLQAMREDVAGTTRLGYNLATPGPTLRFKPGDTVKVALVNDMDEPTNLHVHGLHVSPSGNSDNIFLHIDSGQTFNFQYDIPEDHPPGFYWYHPHPHGHTALQVLNGLAGAIVIEGGLDDLPGISGVTERLLLLQGPFTGKDRSSLNLVNGQQNPAIAIRPGETQRWRIANISANQFYNLQLAGHSLHHIANDGNPLPKTETKDILLLGPGERAEVLVQASDPGIYELRSLAWSPDIPSQAQEQFKVATMIVGGEAMEAQPIPTDLIPLARDLTNAEIAQRRVITFMEQSAAPAFNIDGKAFVEDRIDQSVQLDTVEEWTIRNESPEWHPFHIHVNDYQVMSVNGRPVSPHYEDTTLIPPRGEFVMRTHFADFTGKFVYHCHILIHEDAGMMGTIEVVE
jgi:FtsP/CotA-like multicopper oxidase with cupredoxin domain